MFIWDSAEYKSSTPGCIFTLSTLSVCGCIVCMWRRKGRRKTDVCVGGRWHQRSFQGHIHTFTLYISAPSATGRGHRPLSPSSLSVRGDDRLFKMPPTRAKRWLLACDWLHQASPVAMQQRGFQKSWFSLIRLKRTWWRLYGRTGRWFVTCLLN